MGKTDNYIFLSLKIILAACLATPLLASASFIFPYTAPKAFIFRFLIEIAAVFYLYLALKYPARFLSTLKKRGWGGFLNLSVLIFFAINFLSAIFGADFYTSWWGSLERMGGVWSLLHFAVFFIMAGAVFEKGKDRRLLMNLSVAIGVVAAVLALAQRLGGLGDLLPATDRIFGTIGNAGFFAGYIIFNTFIAGYLFFESAGWRKRLFAAAFLLFVISLLLSGTRGAYLGLAAGILSGIFLAMFYGGKAIKKYAGIFLAIVFVLSSFLFLLRDSALVKNSQVLSRLTAFSLSDATARSRILVWQESWRAWQARPLLGWGPENFEIAAGRYFDARPAKYESYSFDRAHNFVFDYGTEGGWLGLLGYLAIIGAAGFAVLKIMKKDFYFSVFFLSLLAAYLTQNFFIFDSFVSYLMLFLVLAMINGAAGDLPAAEPKQFRNSGLNILRKIALSVFALLVIFSLYSYNLKPVLASYRAHQILSLPAESAALEAPLLNDALSLSSFGSAEIVYQSALDYIDKIAGNPVLAQNEDFYNAASAGLAKAIERSPGRARNYIALAWLDLYFSGRDEQRVGDAIGLGEKAKVLSPAKKDIYLILAAGYTFSGQPAKAQETISQAAAIDVKMGEDAKAYWESVK